MSNYSNTKATIAANVYTNHNNEVTAEMVKAGINAVVDTLIAGGFLYKGVATTSTNPGSPDANVFYIATAPGTYTNFGSLVVNDGEVCILKYNGSWSKEVTGAATAAEVSALGQEVSGMGCVYAGATPVGTTIFDSSHFSAGDKVYVLIRNTGSGQGSFRLFDAANNVLASYYGTSGPAGTESEFYITLPDDFSYAKTQWQAFFYWVGDKYSSRNIEKELEGIYSDTIAPIETNLTRLNPAIKNTISLDDFEIGGINISTSGWSYSSSTKRIRTKQGVSFHLYPGTTISFLKKAKIVNGGTEQVNFYIGWKTADGQYKTEGTWIYTGSYTVLEEGDYVLVARWGADRETFTSSDELAKDISIRSDLDALNYNSMISCRGRRTSFRAVNHRGYMDVAPENTLPAFALSKKMGFNIVETDIRQTSDGVYVLLHDDSINRTATNDDGTAIGSTTYIANITYAQALTYDFGQWKDAKYAGTRIPTLEQFLALCRNLGLHAYLELKLNTQSYVEGVVSLVRAYGMEKDVTYIGNPTALEFVDAVCPFARLGVVVSTLDSSAVSAAQALKTTDNEVFLDAWHYNEDASQQAAFAAAKAAGIPFEVWVVNLDKDIWSLDPYISGATTNAKLIDQMLLASTLEDYIGIL